MTSEVSVSLGLAEWITHCFAPPHTCDINLVWVHEKG